MRLIECRTYLPLHVLRLPEDHRGESDGPTKQSTPQRVRRGLGVRKRDRSHLDVFESLLPEQAGELLLVREPEDRRSDWDAVL